MKHTEVGFPERLLGGKLGKFGRKKEEENVAPPSPLPQYTMILYIMP
jgi:hypothetical protein